MSAGRRRLSLHEETAGGSIREKSLREDQQVPADWSVGRHIGEKAQFHE